jgi:hypothetical protein
MTTRTDAPTFEDVIAGWDEAITCQFPSIGPSGRSTGPMSSRHCAQMGLVASIREYLYQRALAAGCVFGAAR